MSLAENEPGWEENTPEHKPLEINLIENMLNPFYLFKNAI